MRGHRDLRLATAVAVACALLALTLPIEALSLIFAAPLAFFLPGYAIVAAIFVRQPLAGPQRLVLSIGLSLATLALGTIVLNYTPGGLRGFSWAILLSVVVVAACRSAALRRPDGLEWHPTLPRITAAQATLISVGLLATGAALVLTFTTLPAKHAIGYTELWMQPYNANGRVGVRVGIGSDEQHRTAYRLRVRFGQDAVPVVRSFALNPGESRVLRLPTDPSGGSRSRPVVAALFRKDQPNRAYRRVSGWTPADGVSR